MDLFEFDNVKAEKASALRRYSLLQSVANLFRIIEIILALVFVSWISTLLPFAVKISGEYFRRLAVVIAKPLSVFLLANVIIVALVVKSGRNPAGDNAETELYEEFIRNSGDRANSISENNSLPLEPEETVYEDKEIICEENLNTTIAAKESEVDLCKDMETDLKYLKVYRRTKSEITKRECCSERVYGKLRRSETEKCRDMVRPAENQQPENLYPEDKLSTEEFQRKIEAFISKQLKFRRQESLSIVLQHQN